jgi:hypothetical protein
MNHRSRYREHDVPPRSDVRDSIGRFVGESSNPGFVQRYAEEVYHQDRGAFFTKEQLAQMDWQHRAVIETELRRFYGNRLRA